MQVFSEDRGSVLKQEEKASIMQEKLSSLDRAQRRKMERTQERQMTIETRYKEREVKRMLALLSEYTKTYENSYKEYIRSGRPANNLKDINLTSGVEMIMINKEELMANVDNPTLAAIEEATVGDQVRCRYFRVDMCLTYGQDTELHERPGVPEKVEILPEGVKQTLLFYHAVYPMAEENNITQIAADYKLLSDFMTHIFCMGIDMQQMNNNKTWTNRLHAQTENLQAKADEVKEMFSKIGNDND